MSKKKVKTVANEVNGTEVEVPVQDTPKPPMYHLYWCVRLTFKDGDKEEEMLGEYTNLVMFENLKLTERASVMVGQQVLEALVMDKNIV